MRTTCPLSAQRLANVTTTRSMPPVQVAAMAIAIFIGERCSMLVLQDADARWSVPGAATCRSRKLMTSRLIAATVLRAAGRPRGRDFFENRAQDRQLAILPDPAMVWSHKRGSFPDVVTALAVVLVGCVRRRAGLDEHCIGALGVIPAELHWTLRHGHGEVRKLVERHP